MTVWKALKNESWAVIERVVAPCKPTPKEIEEINDYFDRRLKERATNGLLDASNIQQEAHLRMPFNEMRVCFNGAKNCSTRDEGLIELGKSFAYMFFLIEVLSHHRIGIDVINNNSRHTPYVKWYLDDFKVYAEGLKELNNPKRDIKFALDLNPLVRYIKNKAALHVPSGRDAEKDEQVKNQYNLLSQIAGFFE